jgi:hypothetical protein
LLQVLGQLVTLEEFAPVEVLPEVAVLEVLGGSVNFEVVAELEVLTELLSKRLIGEHTNSCHQGGQHTSSNRGVLVKERGELLL